MAKILVCNPKYYDVVYSINPWMQPTKNKTDTTLAIQQWKNLVELLKKIGANVVEMDGTLPDIVFTANAGVVLNKIAILSNFKYPERQPEKQIYKSWFESNGFKCLEFPEDTYFEGAGDCLVNQNHLYCGYGFRSDKKAYEHPFWHQFKLKMILLKLVDPYFYHLDTCFCPLGEYALIYLPAFEKCDIKELKLLQVPKEEAMKFACNAVCINNNVIMQAECPETTRMLTDAGFTVYTTNMSEFIKSGGNVRCLCLYLD